MPAGCKPGERRGGRKKGAPNKVTKTIREAAQLHGMEALERLVYLMKHAEQEATQVSACKEVLDRAYGKSAIIADINIKRETVDFTNDELAIIAAAGRSRAAKEANGDGESASLH
jgi:hypothetical protein